MKHADNIRAGALRKAAREVALAGGTHLTITVAKPWRRPPGFPRIELLSVNPAGERNYRVNVARLMAWIDPELPL